jgi:hypothetical protein
MTKKILYPGQVDWSGENPGMYLKEREDGPFVTLVSFFRVVLSPHGRGHAVVLMQAPQGGPGNFIYSDNEPLARYLLDGYVGSFAAFKGAALGSLEHRRIDSATPSWDSRSQYSETIRAGGSTLKLEWKGVGEAFALEMPAHKSATGKHTMLSVFAGATEGVATLDGKRLPGKPIPRDMAGRKIATAFLAFSETWIRG